jgi:hypothetical protein
MVQLGHMKISPLEDVLQVSGPVTGHNAGELLRAIDEHDAKALQLAGYSSDDRQAVSDLLRRIDAWLTRLDRRLDVSIADSPELGGAELRQTLGPGSHMVVTDTRPSEE